MKEKNIELIKSYIFGIEEEVPLIILKKNNIENVIDINFIDDGNLVTYLKSFKIDNKIKKVKVRDVKNFY